MKYAGLVCLSVMLVLASAALAADSPQFRGPARDGNFADTGLLKSWPEGGPAVAWVAKGLGGGFPSVSVVGDTIYTTGLLENQTGYLFALDMTGAVKQKVAYGKESGNAQGPGTRCTPTIDGQKLYMMSSFGVVFCFELPTLKKVWEVDTFARFGAKPNTWDLAESVLVDGNKVIVTPGAPNASLVALNKETGEPIWISKELSDAASYCSATIITHNGKRLLVTETAKLVVALDPETGKLLWSHPHETDYDIHAVTPIYSDGLLYYTGGYGSGGGALQIAPDGLSVKQAWTDKKLDCQHHGVILKDGYLYGTGHDSKLFVCLEMKTGKVMWETKEVTQGNIIAADGMLYVYEGPKAGVVNLIAPDPAAFKRVSSFKVAEGDKQHWSHPAIAAGKLFIRHGDALVAYNIAAK